MQVRYPEHAMRWLAVALWHNPKGGSIMSEKGGGTARVIHALVAIAHGSKGVR